MHGARRHRGPCPGLRTRSWPRTSPFHRSPVMEMNFFVPRVAPPPPPACTVEASRHAGRARSPIVADWRPNETGRIDPTGPPPRHARRAAPVTIARWPTRPPRRRGIDQRRRPRVRSRDRGGPAGRAATGRGGAPRRRPTSVPAPRPRPRPPRPRRRRRAPAAAAAAAARAQSRASCAAAFSASRASCRFSTCVEIAGRRHRARRERRR